jgi:hypothetical protein
MLMWGGEGERLWILSKCERGGEGLCFNMDTLLWQSWCWMGKNGVEGEVLLLCCWGTIMSLKNSILAMSHWQTVSHEVE